MLVHVYKLDKLYLLPSAESAGAGRYGYQVGVDLKNFEWRLFDMETSLTGAKRLSPYLAQKVIEVINQAHSDLSSPIELAPPTRVVFRMIEGACWALLFDESWDGHSDLILSKRAGGSFQGGDYDAIVKRSTTASEDQYEDLKRNLEGWPAYFHLEVLAHRVRPTDL